MCLDRMCRNAKKPRHGSCLIRSCSPLSAEEVEDFVSEFLADDLHNEILLASKREPLQKFVLFSDELEMIR